MGVMHASLEGCEPGGLIKALWGSCCCGEPTGREVGRTPIEIRKAKRKGFLSRALAGKASEIAFFSCASGFKVFFQKNSIENKSTSVIDFSLQIEGAYDISASVLKGLGKENQQNWFSIES